MNSKITNTNLKEERRLENHIAVTNIKKLLKQKDMSYRQLAAAIEVNSGVISRYMNENYPISPENLPKIATALDVTISSLFTKKKAVDNGEHNASIITLFNPKGGVTKSFSTFNIACCLSRLDKKVLVIDLDSNPCLTYHLSALDGVDASASKNTMTKFFRFYIHCHDEIETYANKKNVSVFIHHNIEGVDYIPSDNHLAKISDYISLERSMSNISVNGMLRTMLTAFLNDYDYILIDCAGNDNLVTYSALTSSDTILVPVIPDSEISCKSLSDFFETLSRADFGSVPVKILFTCVHNDNSSLETINRITSILPSSVKTFKTRIPYCRSIAKASTSTGLSVLSVDKTGDKRISKMYKDLTRELINEED